MLRFIISTQLPRSLSKASTSRTEKERRNETFIRQRKRTLSGRNHRPRTVVGRKEISSRVNMEMEDNGNIFFLPVPSLDQKNNSTTEAESLILLNVSPQFRPGSGFDFRRGASVCRDPCSRSPTQVLRSLTEISENLELRSAQFFLLLDAVVWAVPRQTVMNNYAAWI